MVCNSARRNFGRCKNTFFASCLFHADWNCRSAIVFHHTQHCILKVGKFTRACPCRAFLQSLLSCLVHPYLLRNLFQLLFYSFRQVRFWAWIGATKTPWEGPPQFGESTLELRTIAILDVGICRLQLLCFHNV